MSTFLQGVNNITYTENGAISNKSSLNNCVDLFYLSKRGLNNKTLYDLLEKSYNEDKLITLKLLAYIRDCRGGKGERDLLKQSLKWLAIKDPDNLKCNLYVYGFKYGRIDDLLSLIGTILEEEVINIYITQLKQDINILNDNTIKDKNISLLAKWFPSEGKKIDKNNGIYTKICQTMRIKERTLRKNYLVPLRNYLNLLECKMCKNEWDNINFNTVPSCAMHIHGKSGNAFSRHCEERFNKWKQELAEGKTKVNANLLFPHQIVSRYYGTNQSSSVDLLVEEQWKSMLKKGENLGDFSKTLVLSDVSGSMGGQPMLISITLGILISSLTHEKFKDLVLTFESQPQFCNIKADTLFKKVNLLKQAPWGGSTNFIAALKLILQVAKKNKLVKEEMPNKLIVVSDMQFNQAHDSNYNTNYETLKNLYEQSNYEVPHIIFWNVAGRDIYDVPSLSSDLNVSLVSGFSIDILKCILKNDEIITPYSTMMNAISDERYNDIKLINSEYITLQSNKYNGEEIDDSDLVII